MLLFTLALLMLFIAIPAQAVDQWDKLEPSSDESPSDISTLQLINNESIDRLLTNYKEGCGISYTSASAISIAAGEIVMSNSAGSIRRFRKTTSATAATFSDIDTGSEAEATYYVYAVADTDIATFTIVFSLSSSAPTGATYYKKVGSFDNDSSLDITSSSIADYPQVSANSIPASSLFQIGMIILWSGSEASIPSGWSLCDGTNGTPDLTDKFVVGAGDTYAVNATGGSATHTLTISEMPTHSHNAYFRFAAAGGTATEAQWGVSGSAGNKETSSTGGGGAHENRPPYFALAYIMKT